FEFDVSNNEAEYEALVAGLRIAEQMGVKSLVAKVDSRLVSRSENKNADALSKIASTSFAHLTKQVLVETLKRKSIEEREILAVVEEEGYCWMTPMILRKIPYRRKQKRHVRSRLRQDSPFPEAHGRVKFLIVAVDYFTKWIEAKPIATITGSQVKKFVWDNIVCRFGLLGEIISDNGKQFRDNPLGEVIKARLGEDNRNWVEEVLHVLWAHRTMIKTSNEDTPFSLTYGLLLNMYILEERREKAAVREARSKAKMEKYYNAKVRSTSFRPGDFVYRNNEASHAKESEKLGPKWE
ncbi:reverse transcriptase domain-containing protein, partial [Tanacetum coccineum]